MSNAQPPWGPPQQPQPPGFGAPSPGQGFGPEQPQQPQGFGAPTGFGPQAPQQPQGFGAPTGFGPQAPQQPQGFGGPPGGPQTGFGPQGTQQPGMAPSGLVGAPAPGAPKMGKPRRALNIVGAALFGLYALGHGGYVLYGYFFPPQVKWACEPKSATSISCDITGTRGKGRLCFDVVAQCEDTKHTQNLCTDFKSGKTTTLLFDQFAPPFDLSVKCSKIETANELIDGKPGKIITK